jgi:uncharacterized membrane protein YdbT with pleckstrin-like domain
MAMQFFKPGIRWWSFVDSRLIAHFTEILEVHDDRFVYQKGILNKSEIVIPFSRITNYSADQKLIDRIFGLANFTVETAGDATPELQLRGFPYKLRNILAHALDVK